MGKSRVAPLKQTTMTRMELTAAVLAARMERMLKIDSTIESVLLHCISDKRVESTQPRKSLAAHRPPWKSSLAPTISPGPGTSSRTHITLRTSPVQSAASVRHLRTRSTRLHPVTVRTLNSQMH